MKVTAGINSLDEKAKFVRQAHDLLRSALGADLPLATFVVVDEVPAAAWVTEGRRRTLDG